MSGYDWVLLLFVWISYRIVIHRCIIIIIIFCESIADVRLPVEFGSSLTIEIAEFSIMVLTLRIVIIVIEGITILLRLFFHRDQRTAMLPSSTA